jgi:hypothetical protein
MKAIAANVYAALVIAVVIWTVPRALAVPVMFVALGLPLVFRLIPKNPLYGLRTPRTFADEKTWYAQNTITGWAITLVGVVWLGFVALS